jgi:hypothetical protein
VPWLAALLVMALVSLGDRRLVEDVLLDVADRTGAEWYVGMVTSVCVLGWATAVVSAGWGAWMSDAVGRVGARRFLISGAVLTAYVMADDLLQLHAVVVPRLMGVDKTVVEVVLVLVTSAWLVVNRAEIARTRWMVLLAAAVALATSLATDQLGLWASPRVALLVEDGAKLLGVTAWATYFVVTTRDIGRSLIGEARAGSVGHPRSASERERPTRTVSSRSGPG